MEVLALTRLLAVAISAFRMSGSYLEDEDDLELTAEGTRRRLEAVLTLASAGLPAETTTKLRKKHESGTHDSSETWTCPSRRRSAAGTPAAPAGDAAPSPGRSPSGH